jgi:DNA (cytosine-5)-methyltransferase 1
MKYLSVCSGIEAATIAWHTLGWQPFAFSEIEKFPSQVLAHHYPDVPNLGDMTKFLEWPDATIDLLVGGTPCQSFSVAGLRKGLADPRGNLMLTYLAIAAKYRPKWVVWENVPGVLSSNGGRDFGTFLSGLGQLGYGFAYRVLDAQYYGVAQRRRRVFVVGCLGNWRAAAAVLFERASLSGHPAPSRQAGQEITPTIRAGAANGGKGHGARSGDSKDELIVPIARCVTTGEGKRQDYETCTLVAQVAPTLGRCAHKTPGNDFSLDGGGLIAHSLRGEGFDASEGGTGRGTPLVPVAFTTKLHNTKSNNAGKVFEERSTCLDANSPPPALLTATQVRRLTPRECERLQGFPDDHTLIGPKTADGPRYKALGNSMAVPVMRWIGRRIDLLSNLNQQAKAA